MCVCGWVPGIVLGCGQPAKEAEATEADPTAELPPAAVGIEVCSDGVDNDNDGLVDCEDAECVAHCPVEVAIEGAGMQVSWRSGASYQSASARVSASAFDVRGVAIGAGGVTCTWAVDTASAKKSRGWADLHSWDEAHDHREGLVVAEGCEWWQDRLEQALLGAVRGAPKMGAADLDPLWYLGETAWRTSARWTTAGFAHSTGSLTAERFEIQHTGVEGFVAEPAPASLTPPAARPTSARTPAPGRLPR